MHGNIYPVFSNRISREQLHTLTLHHHAHCHSLPLLIPSMANKRSKAKQRAARDQNQTQDQLLTTAEDWNNFFVDRGVEDPFEYCADWPQLQILLTDCLLLPLSDKDLPKSPADRHELPANLRILVPGCGNSRLSEHLYDAGFLNISNADFSTVAIAQMLERNVRERPEMKWCVMSITKTMKFGDHQFDAVVDKGGLDALKHEPISANFYLFEVKRLLKDGGKYICVASAEPHVLDLLFLQFRFGWKMNLYTIAQEPSSTNPILQPVVVVAEKDKPSTVSDISLVESHGGKGGLLYEAVEKENKIRAEYSTGSVVQYTLEDLKLEAKGKISIYEPGRRIKLILHGSGAHNLFYKCILLDAKQDSGNITHHCAVKIFTHLEAGNWFYGSEQGQWDIVKSSKAARLLMVFLDSGHSIYPMEDIHEDISHIFKQLAPGYINDYHTLQVPIMSAAGDIKRKVVHEVMSVLSGEIVVEDVVYQCHKQDTYRRITFSRTENPIQSDALLSAKIATGTSSKAVKGLRGVTHDVLVNQYHNCILGVMLLFSSYFSLCHNSVNATKALILGLGSGLFPMFMKRRDPCLNIEVVELDRMVLDIAREYFDFEEDECLKVHINDWVEFVKKLADSEARKVAEQKFDLLVVDVASSSPSSGLICPDEKFLEEPFLLAAKKTLSDRGILVLNLNSDSTDKRNEVVSRLKKAFRSKSIFGVKLDGVVNQAIFAMKAPIKMDKFHKARLLLPLILEEKKEKWRMQIVGFLETLEML